jgi:hypothetical protein
VKGPQLQASPGRPRNSLLARVLGALVVTLVLAAIGAALLAGLTAFLILFVLLIPVLLLVAVVLSGRGTLSIRIRSATPEPDVKHHRDVARFEHDR